MTRDSSGFLALRGTSGTFQALEDILDALAFKGLFPNEQKTRLALRYHAQMGRVEVRRALRDKYPRLEYRLTPEGEKWLDDHWEPKQENAA